MGEISNLILDGVLCEECGAYIGEPIYAPRKCKTCASKNKQQIQRKTVKRGKNK